MKALRGRGVVARFLSPSLPVLIACGMGHAQESHAVMVHGKTDVLSDVPSNKVMITQLGAKKTVLSDSQGLTPWVPIQPDVPLTFTLRQKNTAEGLAVGQVVPHTFSSLEVDHQVYDLILLFQPILQPVVLDSSLDYRVGLGTRWAFGPLEDSEYQFPASIGVLLTPQEISAFAAYYSVGLFEDDYAMGLLIHVADPEPIEGGMDLQMDFTTYGFSELPPVDWYHLALSGGDVGSGSFEVEPLDWNPAEIPERGYYVLTGTPGRGFNLLLFGGSAAYSFNSSLVTIPTFPPVVGQGGLGGTIPLTGGGQDCVPQPSASAPGQTCESTDSCEDDAGCADSGCSSTMAPLNCSSRKYPVGEKHCGQGPQDGKTVSWTVSFSGGINFEVKIGSEDAGGSVGAGAHAGGGASKEDQQPLIPGAGAHGCGECVQAFQELTVCKKSCMRHKAQRSLGRTLGGGYLCVDEPCSMGCIKATGTSVERCSRTGC